MCSSDLSIITNKEIRSTFSKIRISNHILQIEKDRHSPKPIPVEKRICKMCSLNEVEDEHHFVMVCPYYAKNRQQFLTSIYNSMPSLKHLTSLQQFTLLFNSKEADVLMLLSKFIHSIYNCRKIGPTHLPKMSL